MSRKFRRELPLHMMLLPCVIIVVLFSYIPMAGIVIAFQKFVPAKGVFGSAFVGLENFRYLFSMPDFIQVVWNTLFIAALKIVFSLLIPLTFALLLNEVANHKYKRIVQTTVYFPHFLSWVILAGILIDILSPSSGLVNKFLGYLGIEPIFFLGSIQWFPYTMVFSDVLKEFGFNAIVYLAALTAIDPTLYEAAVVDGANRWKQTLHVTIPGISHIVILMMVLSLGNVLNAGFDQIFNLYSPSVYQSGDILDTMVYRLGLENAQFSLSTAAGLFKSVVSFVLISTSYYVAVRFTDYRIF